MRLYRPLLVAAVVLLVSCGKEDNSKTQAAASTPNAIAPAASEASNSVSAVPTPPPMQPVPPAPPPHNYQMVDRGTYGYEPALSEDDVRRGTATKALIMMRYEGVKDGQYVILILGDDPSNSAAYARVSCQLPCQFAKSQTILGGTVLKTETLRVTSTSLMGAMLEDAVNGALVPYGRAQRSSDISVPTSDQASGNPTTATAPQQDAPSANGGQPSASFQPGSSKMWIGPLDVNLRACAGASADCPSIAVVPKRTKVDVDTSSIKDVAGTTGPQTSWVKVTFTGLYCDPNSLDPKLGCVAPIPSSGPITGWVNYQLLRPTDGSQ